MLPISASAAMRWASLPLKASARSGAFLAAIFVGMIDTLGRAFLPDLLRMVLSSAAASTAAPALSSMLIYLLMAIVLVVRPEGLFPAAKR